MIYDFSGKILSLSGEEVVENGSPVKMSTLLANLIVSSQKGVESWDTIKNFNIAQSIYNEGSVELSKEDAVKLMEFVKEAPGIVLFVKAQLIMVLIKE